jgi:hypothetical protein
MLKPLSALAVLVALGAATARAEPQMAPPVAAQAQEQAAPPPLPAVDTLTCDQMQAEMMSAGQQMHAQMDPNFATDVQTMRDTMTERQRQATAGAVGTGLMCAVPGLGMVCAAAQQAQMSQQMAHAQEDQARMNHITGSIQNSMAGIDQERMTAISNRWESQHCQMPQAPQASEQTQR